MRKSYSELKKLKTFEERFNYLKLEGSVGIETFGKNRYLNQRFYNDKSGWRKARDSVIIRDGGNELGLDGYPINGMIFVHHINPITPEDILERDNGVLDPENLICVSKRVHDALHYGSFESINPELNTRSPNDTSPWRNKR